MVQTVVRPRFDRDWGRGSPRVVGTVTGELLATAEHGCDAGVRQLLHRWFMGLADRAVHDRRGRGDERGDRTVACLLASRRTPIVPRPLRGGVRVLSLDGT